MKNLFLIALSVFVSTSFAAEKVVESKIESVTVFYQGAQVTRTFKASFVKGETELVLSQLENSIRGNSIQVLGNGPFTIKSFFTRTNFLEPKDYSKELRDLENHLKTLNEEQEELKLDISVLQDEENLILGNKDLAGQQSGLKIEELQKAAAFYKLRLKEIRLEKLEANRNIKVNNTQRQKIQNQMNQIRSISRESVEELVVKIEADKAGTANFTISYYVPSASWTPFYQVNVIDVNQPIQLVYKANVSQKTGVNWNNVDLTLSTTEPNLSGQVPNLSPWFLNFIQPITFRGSRSGAQGYYVDGVQSRNGVGVLGNIRGHVADAVTGETIPFANVIALDANGNTINGATTDIDGIYSIDCKQKAFSLQVSYIGYQKVSVPINGSTINITLRGGSELMDQVVISSMEKKESRSISQTYKPSTMAQKAIFFEYALAGKNTVLSNSLTEVVHIKDLEIDAKFEYQCVPKLDKDVFLVAKIYGWEDYNLLNGAARLYFERTFVGESYLDVESTEDTLGLSLGRDKNIIVTRDKILENSMSSGFNGNKKEIRNFKIQVRNNKKTAIKLVLTDQYPISTNKKITTKLNESSDAKVNEINGILVWRLKVEPSENVDLKLEYTVSYPQGTQINLNE